MAALCWARLLIAVVPFRRWRDRLGGSPSPDAAPLQPADPLVEGRRLARQVEWAAHRLPFSTKCLPRAMALSWILRGKRIGHVLVFAVRPAALRDTHHALHAWERPAQLHRPGGWLVCRCFARSPRIDRRADAGKPRALRTYYNVLDIPDVPRASDAELIARAGELLDEGVKACMTGFRTPGATLSGGLDSPQVAVRVLANLAPSERLPSFTFHTEEGFDGLIEPWLFADDRPFVEAFAAMHPRLEPHFTANEGYEHDYRFNDFFHLMGGAPSCLCNMYVFHGLFRGAASRGCDVLLVADLGNETFSNAGDWGFVEYLFTGRLRQYWLALSRLPKAHRSIARRFVAKTLMPLLPARLWRLVRRLAFPHRGPLLDQIEPLTPAYRRTSGAEIRLQDSGVTHERYNPRNRKHASKLQFERGDFETDEIYQGFEQMYGIAQRDPTAYRPLVEFCLGLPTRMFMRDGEMRWLARQMARGIMPEKQRTNPLHGRWDSDWHLRIGRRRHDFIAELDRMSSNERVASIVDIPRLKAALEDWPEHTEIDRHKQCSREMAVPRGLLTARFIDFVEAATPS